MRVILLFGITLSLAAQSPEVKLVRDRDYAKLSKLLRDPKFLARPDNRLSEIMTALAVDPTGETAALCHTLANDRVFLSDPDRMLYLLNVLGAVKPMTRPTADLFRSTNQIGYFGPNAILLAVNGSPAAMELFESMMLDTNHPIENRIEYMRFGIIPRRTSLPILTAAGNILSKTKESRLAIGLIECLFDYRPEWFRPDNAPAPPPPWQTAPPESLRKGLDLASHAQRRRDLPLALRRSVDREIIVIRSALVRHPR